MTFDLIKCGGFDPTKQRLNEQEKDNCFQLVLFKVHYVFLSLYSYLVCVKSLTNKKKLFTYDRSGGLNELLITPA